MPQGGSSLARTRTGTAPPRARLLLTAATGVLTGLLLFLDERADVAAWRQLPPVFGPSGPTAHRRFTEWSSARVWARFHRVILDELGSRGGPDWSRCAIDSVNMRALKEGS